MAERRSWKRHRSGLFQDVGLMTVKSKTDPPFSPVTRRRMRSAWIRTCATVSQIFWISQLMRCSCVLRREIKPHTRTVPIKQIDRVRFFKQLQN